MLHHHSRTMLAALGLVALGNGAAPGVAHAQAVEVFAAGSLRAVVTDVAAAAMSSFQIEVKPSFGGSGSMRERIEKGEPADLLLSADLGSPRKLEAQGRTIVPAVAFARNRMCIVARRSEGITTRNLVDRLLAKRVRLKTSIPIADPSGDYAWAIFDRVEASRPGAGAALKEKAQASMNLTAAPSSPSQSAAAALFQSGQIDVSITYCSASAGLQKELPELVSLPVPPQLDPHPVYGIAVLSSKPEAMRIALFLLSEQGQAIIARNGLVPIRDPVGAAVQ